MRLLPRRRRAGTAAGDHRRRPLPSRAAATGQILAAWIAKEELRALVATARRGQRHDIAQRPHRFYDWCARTDVPELEWLAGTIDAWWPEIHGFLTSGVTNAGTEATNRTVSPWE